MKIKELCYNSTSCQCDPVKLTQCQFGWNPHLWSWRSLWEIHDQSLILISAHWWQGRRCLLDSCIVGHEKDMNPRWLCIFPDLPSANLSIQCRDTCVVLHMRQWFGSWNIFSYIWHYTCFVHSPQELQSLALCHRSWGNKMELMTFSTKLLNLLTLSHIFKRTEKTQVSWTIEGKVLGVLFNAEIHVPSVSRLTSCML